MTENYSREYDPLADGSLLSITAAARLVGCTRSTLYEARRSGALATYELGDRKILVSRSDLASWLASRRHPARHDQEGRN
jgi:excisionase family DNA binding protein